jgi:hypothetical protein
MNSLHLTHAEMLLLLDGEVAHSEKSKVETHLQRCWTCRVELDHLRADIATIVEAERQAFTPGIAPPERAWAQFDALLARSVPESPVSLWSKLAAWLRPARVPWRVALLATLFALSGMFLRSLLKASPVSASEILLHVHVADVRRDSITKRQLIHQRLHVRLTGRAQQSSRTESVDAWKSTTTTYWDAPDAGSAVSALKDRYHAHDIPVDLPLSSASVGSWILAAGGTPTVSKADRLYVLDFDGKTQTSQNGGTRLSLLIEPDSWKVQRMTLDFADASFEVSEDSFAIVPTTMVSPKLLALLHVDPESSAIEGRAIAKAAAVEDSAPVALFDPDKVELEAMEALHVLHADLGEPITLSHTRSDVKVGVWQVNSARQDEVVEALERIPGVIVEKSAPPPAVSSGVKDREVVLPLGTALRSVVLGDREGEDTRLTRFFKSARSEQNFTRDALSRSSNMLAHLYALRNLQDEFPEERERKLSSSERAQLAALIQDHAASASAALSDLQNYMVPLNQAFNVEEKDAEPDSEVGSTSWQQRSVHALEIARNSDHLLRSFLTTNQAPIGANSALPELRHELSRLSMEILILKKM